jgi:hypothetical protein
MALASDIYDPDTGLDHSGDAGLHVEFYEKKVTIPANPEINRPEAFERMEVYCRIIIPGDKTFAHDQPVRDYDKQRFPRHWMAFQVKNNEQGPSGFGTPLEQWVIDKPGVINENQRVELAHLGFRTVEQVAMATDMQVQRMGLGALGMRDGARTYLKDKQRGDSDGEQEAMKAQIADLKALVEKLANPTAVAIRAAIKDIVPLDPTIPPLPRKVRGPNKIKRGVAARNQRHVIDPASTGDASHG